MLLHCIIIIVGLVLGATEGDICKGTTTSALESHVSSNYPPKGGAEAGNFTQINGVENFSECVKACCDDPTCNAAFFSKNKCLNIECVTDDGCSPNHDKTLPKAILVNVRTVAETAALHTSHNVSTDEPTTAPPSVQPLKNVTCEFGLQECGENEECKVGEEENRRANGICVCQENYSRDSSGKCVQLDPVTLTSAEKKSSVVPIQLPAHTTTAKSPPTTPKPKIVPLTVSAGDSKILEYPEDSTKLSAYAIPEPQPGETYTYQWSLVQAPDGDEKGQTSGMDSPTLILTKLVPGVYVLTVDVKGDNKQGSATVNVTVMPEPKAHTPPVAVIKPSVLNIKEGTTGILDGADSTVDGETKSYLWEIVSAPINDDYKLVNSKASILRLTGLSHGTYSIRLTVTDAAGLKNSTMAAVNVEEEVDYPPTANAGDDIVVNLPVNYVTLYGNTSTDDKGIHSYEWKATDTDSTTDLEGVHEPFLRLKHLTEGVYTFELLVTDTKGQTSKDEVRVFVQTSLNKPPVAMVEHNFTTAKPQDVVLLDGSPSSDDQGIVQYRWTQLSGPNQAKMDNSDRVKASVENLIEGEYVFKLTVSDAETLHDSATVTVQVKSLSSEKPVAAVKAPRTVVLPVDILRVDGSASTVNSGKVAYKWSKSDDSPGAGSMVNGTDTAAVLLVTDIISGVYIFTLQVMDEEGRHDSSSITIDVQPDPQSLNLVEISLDASIESFTEKHKKDMMTQLVLLLPPPSIGTAETKVEITGVYPDYHSGKLTVLFLVKDYISHNQYSVRNGTVVEDQLKEKLQKDNELLGFTVSKIDTVVCQNDCSGHGYCDQFSKECVCEPFWMPNYARATWQGESNCDWSILYVVVITIASLIALMAIIWMCVCCTRRCKRSRGRRKHTYKLLQDIEQMENEEKLAKKKRNNITAGSGSIFLSETDMSSEEDTLFANGGKLNSNNFNSSADNFVKANNLKNKLRA